MEPPAPAFARDRGRPVSGARLHQFPALSLRPRDTVAYVRELGGVSLLVEDGGTSFEGWSIPEVKVLMH